MQHSEQYTQKTVPIRSYTFSVRIEKDAFPDGKVGYYAVVPDLEERGAVAQGKTRAEALKNIQEVLEIIIEELLEEGQKISRRIARVSNRPIVTISV